MSAEDRVPEDELEFYFNEDGDPCARGSDQRMATFLETDIQGSVAIAEELLELLDSSHKRIEFDGNGHSVVITPVMATIGSSFDEDAPDRRLEREEFRTILQAWLAFIR